MKITSRYIEFFSWWYRHGTFKDKCVLAFCFTFLAGFFFAIVWGMAMLFGNDAGGGGPIDRRTRTETLNERVTTLKIKRMNAELDRLYEERAKK